MNIPKYDGDFYYTGNLPKTDKLVTAIVQVCTHPATGNRFVCLLIPPGWRGNKDRINAEVVIDDACAWTGEFSGPEFGLNTMVIK